jgi:hypothetical protein
MAALKIRTASFKLICEEARSIHEFNTQNGFGLTYRDAMREAIDNAGDYWKASDEYLAALANTPASFDEIYSNLRIAAQVRQHMGASEAQCREIARRWASEGASLAACRVNTLTAGEARAILG